MRLEKAPTGRALAAAVLLLLVVAALAACAQWHRAEASRCEQLEGLKLDRATINAARSVGGGAHFSLPLLMLAHRPLQSLPASCRVAMTLRPSADSEIHAELWMPQDNWNGRLQGIGNGGFAGSIDRLQLSLSLQQHYAAVNSDTGHESSDKDGSWALGHPEKIRDYGWRAAHEMTVKAKAVIAAYYGEPPRYAYFTGGSYGGRTALREAQRYPEDYDGIIAGCPAYDGTNSIATAAWLQKLMTETPGAYIPPAELPAIAARVMAACDALDGVQDGVIDDPRRCAFDPASMRCTHGDGEHCLTAPQVDTLRRMYDGPGGAFEDSRNRGFERGSEPAWKNWHMGRRPSEAAAYVYALDFIRYLVYGDAGWSLGRFDFARDRREIRERLGPDYDARDPDLGPFEARGGKLIMYHGWADPALQPRLAVDYYENVRRTMGAAATVDFMRLYMVPGMYHCIGGPGANAIGQLPPGGSADPAHSIGAALEAWVEHGRAPQAIVSAKYEDDFKGLLAPETTRLVRTRPLCPYPQVARWSGRGSTDRAENFSCVAPPDGDAGAP